MTTAASWVWSQSLYNHPELEWMTLETGHFYVHYHAGAERTARVTASVAESIYEPVTRLYDYEPDTKIHFVIRDHDDQSNGAAFYYDNKIELWAPAMDFALRGTHHWLLNVITHEFSHMISMGAARKAPRQIPAVYLQWLDYEKEKRPDVIHGYPRTLVSLPLAGTVMPVWFAEGMAQYHARGVHHDTWDSHRDMLLRTAVREKALLPPHEMSRFGKTSLGNERVYNQGYALTLYLVDRFGESVLPRLVEALRPLNRIRFTAALESVTGLSEAELYRQWVQWLENGYEQSGESWTEGEILESAGEANFFPVFSPDGRYLAYVSSRGRDYMSQSSVWIFDRREGKARKTISRVTSPAGWSPDGKHLVYSSNRDRGRHGSRYHDLYVYNLETRKEKRLTRDLRAHSPAWGPGGMLACIIENDGTSNLFLLNTEGDSLRSLTAFKAGEQLFAPRWMSDSTLVFTIGGAFQGRDIAMIHISGGQWEYLLKTAHDERDAVPGLDGECVYYSSDATGAFNIYRLHLPTGERHQLTHVPGGAFMPAVRGDTLCYALFTADGYRIAKREGLSPLSARTVTSPYFRIKPEKRPIDIAVDTSLTAKPYQPVFSKLAFLPRIMMDYPQKLKLGTYFYGSDFLDRISVLGGAAANFGGDMDLFGIFEYRRWRPTLFVEAYHQTRHFRQDDVDYRFNLMEVDAGADWRLGDNNVLRTAAIFSRYSAGMRFTDQGLDFKFSYIYHLGTVLQARWNHRAIRGALNADIAPSSGRIMTLDIQAAWQRFLRDFKIHQDFGTLVEVYEPYHYWQLLMDWTEYVPSPVSGHSLAIRVKGGWIDRRVEGFYHLFGGGLDGMKGYPYYSLEGRNLIHLGLAYRMPLFRRMRLRLGFMDLEKLYVSVYGDAGNAWSGGSFPGWKRDVGVQLRLSMLNFYAYPMKVFFDAAYGLDEFVTRKQTYGREWRFYFGMLFDFLR